MEQNGADRDDAARRAYWASIQDENGVDMTLIRENLKLSVEERLRRGEVARRQALWVRMHAKRVKGPGGPPAEDSR